MQIRAIKTPKIEIGDDILNIIISSLPMIEKDAVIVVTSKIISLAQGRVVDKSSITKYDLIRQEVDIIYADGPKAHDFYLTMKDGILIPSAGIDESNIDGYYILWPHSIQEVAANICQQLRQHYDYNSIGVLITDSTVLPRRQGVSGIAIGWAGFLPCYNYIGQTDLVGNSLKVTKINLIDSLAAAAVLCMGEGNECTPLAVIENIPKIEFTDSKMQDFKTSLMPEQEDLYYDLLNYRVR